ncbi:hypothetical protein MJM59_27675, partial [Salmonella enterica subsp. enterica serovar Montevideo]|nr:hypothetical protein [Salmonella enterica subsp. enterica serovar Montevideo]
IRVIAAVIGVVLWAASLAALSYYVIYGQEFSQSVLFVMFETNANEVYLYFNMEEDSCVFHMMGQPQETRHIVMRNEQAVISPSWSI